MKRVRSWGRLDARLVMLAEAPGAAEDKLGEPLVGPSWRVLRDWLSEVGLKRRDFHIMNVMEYMCPGSKIANAPRDEVEAWASTVHARLAVLADPWLIVPLGEIALRALFRQPLWSPKSYKIGDWRGSIMQVDGVKVIPSYHPAATFRDPSLAKICRADWRRIAGDAGFRELRLPKRTHLTLSAGLIEKDSTELDILVAEAQSKNTVLAIDIETSPREGKVLCVGFASAPHESITLEWRDNRVAIKTLCESPCAKVLQNGLYDATWLAREGIEIRNYNWDILAMHHALDSTLPHDLATMASLDTRQPFWKKSHKDTESPDALEKTPLERLMIYNGIDCCCTRELFDVYYERLRCTE